MLNNLLSKELNIRIHHFYLLLSFFLFFVGLPLKSAARRYPACASKSVSISRKEQEGELYPYYGAIDAAWDNLSRNRYDERGLPLSEPELTRNDRTVYNILHKVYRDSESGKKPHTFEETTRLLTLALQAGKSVNPDPERSNSPLAKAATMKPHARALVQWLVAHDAAINGRNIKGDTALMKAQDPEEAAPLLEHKADPNLRNNKNETALECFFYTGIEREKPLIQLLWDNGYNFLAPLSNGILPLNHRHFLGKAYAPERALVEAATTTQLVQRQQPVDATTLKQIEQYPVLFEELQTTYEALEKEFLQDEEEKHMLCKDANGKTLRILHYPYYKPIPASELTTMLFGQFYEHTPGDAE